MPDFRSEKKTLEIDIATGIRKSQEKERDDALGIYRSYIFIQIRSGSKGASKSLREGLNERGIECNWNKDDDITPAVSSKKKESKTSRVDGAEKSYARAMCLRVGDVVTSFGM